MLRRLVRRCATAVLTLLLVTLLVFGLTHLVPGDPLTGESADPGVRPLTRDRLEQLRTLYRLDRPVPVQYGLWLGDLLRGDLGTSFSDGRPVLEKMTERLGVTLLLNALSLGLMVLLAVPLGTLAALRPGSRLDRWTGGLTYALYALPVFWAGLLLQIAFSVRLGWLPLFGLASEGAAGLGAAARLADRAAHLVLPVICLGYGGLAYLSRFVRANLLDNALLESGRAARARGLSELAVLVRHGFAQAAVPMLTLAGFLLPALVGGSVIVETIFAIPGLGMLFVEAVLDRDIPVLMGVTLLGSSATLAGILAADLLYAVADPRVRRGEVA